ncbi:MAG TPA: hypothetical protein EYQ24_03590 [Bacteroidetes bacterium]|nr:hypothetical protein [Bacteroidota bacterium]
MVRLCLLVLSLALSAAGLSAQPALRVAYDCQTGGCDRAYFQTELPYVQFVRDQGDADAFVLVTGDGTGGGGRLYTLFFQGRARYKGQTTTLTVAVPADATDDDERRALVSRLALGLAPFVAGTSAGDRLTLSYEPPPGGVVGKEVPPADPWNGWVFRLNGSARVNGQSARTSLNSNSRVSAERITEGWKTRLSVSGFYNRSTFDDPTGSAEGTDTTFVSETSGANIGGLAARSFGENLTAGLQASALQNTYTNYDARLVVGPAVEYSLFPYRESTRRLLTASYGVAVEAAAYGDTTIYGKKQEVLPQHSARLSTEFAQPWGSVDVSLRGQQYLSQLDKYEVGVFGGLNVRLARGLQVNLGGSAAYIRNQLSLAAGGLTTEEILTQQRQQATNFRYYGNVGVSFSFGSIYNAAVNPRFVDGGGVIVAG